MRSFSNKKRRVCDERWQLGCDFSFILFAPGQVTSISNISKERKKEKLETNFVGGETRLEAFRPLSLFLTFLSVHALRSRSGSCSNPRSETNHQLSAVDDDDDDGLDVFGVVDFGVGRRRSPSSSHLESARESPRIAALAAPDGEALGFS